MWLQQENANPRMLATSLPDPRTHPQMLLVQGLLALRPHAEQMVALARSMRHSGCPCFKAGDRAIANMEARFHLDKHPQQCLQVGGDGGG